MMRFVFRANHLWLTCANQLCLLVAIMRTCGLKRGRYVRTLGDPFRFARSPFTDATFAGNTPALLTMPLLWAARDN
jgi:hypothetical protein